MKQVVTYLLFDGNCAEAMHFYARVLAGRIELLTTVGDSPVAAQFPASSAQLARSIFDALSEQGRVESALQPTPFARAYGTLVDRFSVPWQVMVE